MQNITATLEDSLAVSFTAMHILTMQSSIHAPGYYPIDLKIYLHTHARNKQKTAHIYSSVIHNQHKL